MVSQFAHVLLFEIAVSAHLLIETFQHIQPLCGVIALTIGFCRRIVFTNFETPFRTSFLVVQLNRNFLLAGRKEGNATRPRLLSYHCKFFAAGVSDKIAETCLNRNFRFKCTLVNARYTENGLFSL